MSQCQQSVVGVLTVEVIIGPVAVKTTAIRPQSVDEVQTADALTLPLVPAGLAVAWLVEPAKLADHVLGAVVGFLALAAVGFAYRRLRGREGLGLGDAKLFAGAGAWVTWQGLPSVLLLAAAAALAWQLAAARLGGRQLEGRELPFGPYLGTALWLVWLYGPIVVG